MGPRTKQGRRALWVASLGALLLVVSAFSSWAQPARVPWPSYTDGVPDLISHPSDAAYRIGAALLGVVAFALVVAARRGLHHPVLWGVIALLGLGGIAVGVTGFDTVSHYHGFGSMIANDMTLSGFHHGPLNYAELAGAVLISLSPLAALRARRA